MNEEYLISTLSKVNGVDPADLSLFGSEENQIRALMNVTMPFDLPPEFYRKQDEYLKDRLSREKVIDVSLLPGRISLYRGDITLLKADAIVNAGNSALLGCFVPLHSCIDNAIHSKAGLEVRRDLMQVMSRQGHEEENGKVKVTQGYNLPSAWIFHTVGPQVRGSVTSQDEEDLRSCYLSCLKEADRRNVKSLVFPCLSTGLFDYPIEPASLLAVMTVKNYLEKTGSNLHVVFDVFSPRDESVYRNVFRSLRISYR